MSRKVINIVKKNKINQFNLSLNLESAGNALGRVFYGLNDIEEIENFVPTADINIATLTIVGNSEKITLPLIKIYEEYVEGEEIVLVVYSGFLRDSSSGSSISIVAAYSKQKPDEFEIISVTLSTLYLA